MPHAQNRRVFAAPVAAVASAIDATNARDGDQPVQWNAQRTIGRESGGDVIVDIHLTALGGDRTEARLSVTATTRPLKVACVLLGRPALWMVLRGLEAEVGEQKRSPESGAQGPELA